MATPEIVGRHQRPDAAVCRRSPGPGSGCAAVALHPAAANIPFIQISTAHRDLTVADFAHLRICFSDRDGGRSRLQCGWLPAGNR
jgi:hypothetical protein